MSDDGALAPASGLLLASASRPGGIRVVGVLRAALLVVLSGNLLRLPALSAGEREAPVSLNDLALLGVLLTGLVACLQSRRFIIDGVARRALLFACVGALSALLAVPRFGLTGREVAFSLAYLARWIGYFGVYVVAVNCLRKSDVPTLIATIEHVVLAFALFGIAQSIFLPGFAQLVYPDAAVFLDWDPQGRRLVSTFLDPNYAGAFIDFGLMLAVARLSYGDRRAGTRVVVLSVALVFTASRSSMLAAVIGGAIIAGAVGLSRRVLRLLLLLGVCALAALPSLLTFAREYGKLAIDASALQRVVAWARGIQIIADHPIIGIGFNTYGFVQRAYGGNEAGHAASGYSLDGGLLFVAVMTGAVGVAIYLAMIGRMTSAARQLWRAADALPSERAIAVAAVASTVALLVHSIFVNSLFLPYLMEPLWLLWAAVAVVHRARAGRPIGARA